MLVSLDMLQRPLFVYGTLRDTDVLGAVLGSRPDGRNIAPAVAPGYRVVFYPGRTYPALVASPGGRAEGAIILGLSRQDRDLLDAFEGPEYRRAVVPVLVEGEIHEADGYLPAVPVTLDAEPWSLSRWQLEHKVNVLPDDATAADEIRGRLSASRRG